jgi:colanic acid biosynthesis protein WcaH
MSKKFIPEKLYQKIVGLLPICCVDLVIKKNNSFLLVKRLENPVKNHWWFPGGRILFNESLQFALKRKLKEELNIKNFQKVKFLGVKEKKFKRGRFNKPVYTINNVFLVKIPKKECSNIRTDYTAATYKWFEGIQKEFHPYIKNFLELAGFK